MRLKVVCQVCGRTESIETREVTGWRDYAVSDFVALKEGCPDYNFWLCPSCAFSYIEWEGENTENYYWPIIRTLDLRKEDLKGWEYEEMKAEERSMEGK